MKKRSGLADSPFFSKVPVYDAATPSVAPPVAEKPVPAPATVVDAPSGQTPSAPSTVPDSGSSRLPDSGTSGLPDFQTPVVPDSGSSKEPDFASYEVPDYRKMRRIEVRLTYDQNHWLDDLEWRIARDWPGVEKGNPESRRITKNSIIRVLIEILRTLELDIDPSHFRNERDLLITLRRLLKGRLTDPGTSRLRK